MSTPSFDSSHQPDMGFLPGAADVSQFEVVPPLTQPPVYHEPNMLQLDESSYSPDGASEQLGRIQRAKGFLKRQTMKLCVGATAASLAATALLDPMGDTKDKVLEAAPYVATGVVASEALWLGGAAMMLGAVGSKVKNPLKIKKSIPEIAEKANDSKLFKAGFAVNVAGALGDFVVLSAGVMTKLPPHSWGTLSFTLLDLGVTLGVRKAMLNGIHENVEKSHQLDVDFHEDQAA